jgi:hypothetical protein
MWFLLASLASAYTPVRGLDFPNKTEVKEYEFYHGIKFKFQISRQKITEYYDKLIYQAIYFSSLASWKKIEPMGLIDRQCDGDDLVEIFEISESELNNPSRFPAQYIGNRELGRFNLWGYYDPRATEPGFDAIVVSPHGDDAENYRIIVHEIAHYWYNSFCLDSYIRMSSEDFAVMIQKEVTWD